MSMHKGMVGKVGPASVELLEQCYKSGQITEQQWQDHLMSDKTLGDYIARKQRNEAFNQVKKEKKLTFEEWAVSSGYGYWVSSTTFGWASLYFNEEDVRNIWKAAQENK